MDNVLNCVGIGIATSVPGCVGLGRTSRGRGGGGSYHGSSAHGSTLASLVHPLPSLRQPHH